MRKQLLLPWLIHPLTAGLWPYMNCLFHQRTIHNPKTEMPPNFQMSKAFTTMRMCLVTRGVLASLRSCGRLRSESLAQHDLWIFSRVVQYRSGVEIPFFASEDFLKAEEISPWKNSQLLDGGLKPCFFQLPPIMICQIEITISSSNLFSNGIQTLKWNPDHHAKKLFTSFYKI